MPGGGLEGRGFLDAGANIGSATCLALTRYDAGEAWVFEPAPENVTLLRQNVLANGLDHRVHVHTVALSDHEGAVAFELSDKSCGDHRVRVDHASNDGPPALLGETQRRTVEVHARRLDSLVDESAIDLGSLGLAWIDVQGHEGHVFEGAAGLLASDVPIVWSIGPMVLRARAGWSASTPWLQALVRDSSTLPRRAPRSARPTARLSALRARYPRLASTDLLLLR